MDACPEMRRSIGQAFVLSCCAAAILVQGARAEIVGAANTGSTYFAIERDGRVHTYSAGTWSPSGNAVVEAGSHNDLCPIQGQVVGMARTQRDGIVLCTDTGFLFRWHGYGACRCEGKTIFQLSGVDSSRVISIGPDLHFDGVIATTEMGDVIGIAGGGCAATYLGNIFGATSSAPSTLGRVRARWGN